MSPWDGKPFVESIYYGARIVRYGDGRVGSMLDFTHSKTIARLDEDAAFTGTLNGAPARSARAARYLPQARGRATAQHADAEWAAAAAELHALAAALRRPRRRRTLPHSECSSP